MDPVSTPPNKRLRNVILKKRVQISVDEGELRCWMEFFGKVLTPITEMAHDDTKNGLTIHLILLNSSVKLYF